MHYTGTIWRPPHEMYSAWIEVTQGCSHHRCQFCQLYQDIPFSISKMDDVIEDFYEISSWYPQAKRVFLIGANPFVLSYTRLKGIVNIAKLCFPQFESIGCFARITDIAFKSDDELRKLHELGYDELSIGIESGYDAALSLMNKGFSSQDIIEQCHRLKRAHISYHLFYIVGLGGHLKAIPNALDTASVMNQLHPRTIIVSTLMIFENTPLAHKVQKKEFIPATSTEKLLEIKTFLQNCTINTHFFANNISNELILEGKLPRDSDKLIEKIDQALVMK